MRESQRQVEDIGSQAEETIEKHLFKRFENLYPVRRFVITWVGLIFVLMGAVIVQNVALSGYFQALKTVPGGIYSEGLTGTYTNANPIYATSDSDSTVSRLIFAGLLKADDQGKLIGDLASNYSVDATGKIYTVHLKPNLKWQDGHPLTSKDVVYTYQTIQNPDSKSPLFSSWQGIVVSAPDKQTVTFKLPETLASFPFSLTMGILPEHLLSNIPPSDLRSADFNTVHPVGAGPFEWQAVQVINGSDTIHEQVQIGLKPFKNYNGGMPKLEQFTIKIFADPKQLVTEFTNKQLTAMEAITPPSKSVQNIPGVVSYDFILRAANMVFFKTTTGVLADKTVRHALIQGTNIQPIIKELSYSTHAVDEPLLKGQLAYNLTYAQAQFNQVAAKKILDSDGWVPNSNGIRYKSGQKLSFTLTAANTSENQLVTKNLEQQWSHLGVTLNTQFLEPADLQSALSYHDYEAVLTPISIGTDPDVFVYWDSSQADIRSANRLNLSEYNNPKADGSLEAGRTRLDSALRVIKYAPFLQAWQQDAPALGLYQPRLLYLTNGTVGGLSDQALTTATDRFNNIQNWEIREAKVTH